MTKICEPKLKTSTVVQRRTVSRPASNTPGVAGERLTDFPFADFLLIEERPPQVNLKCMQIQF